jgi:hypothetical protein
MSKSLLRTLCVAGRAAQIHPSNSTSQAYARPFSEKVQAPYPWLEPDAYRKTAAYVLGNGRVIAKYAPVHSPALAQGIHPIPVIYMLDGCNTKLLSARKALEHLNLLRDNKLTLPLVSTRLIAGRNKPIPPGCAMDLYDPLLGELGLNYEITGKLAGIGIDTLYSLMPYSANDLSAWLNERELHSFTKWVKSHNLSPLLA